LLATSFFTARPLMASKSFASSMGLGG
jgi:hypothetical protein